MSRARSLGQAEQVALHCDNESQDSQLILQIYAKHFGVGETSSSPPRDFEISHRDASTSPPAIAARSTPATSPIPNGIAAETHATHERTQDSPNPATTLQLGRHHDQSSADHPGSDPVLASERILSGRHFLGFEAIASRVEPFRSLPSTSGRNASETNQTPAPDHFNPQCGGRRDEHTIYILDHHREIETVNVVKRKAKMSDNSQASPTQKNDDRDYQNHYDAAPSSDDSPIPESPQPLRDAVASGEGDRTLDGDTGLVHFGSLDFHHDSQKSDFDPVSPIVEGPGLANTRHGWKLRTSSSQQHSSMNRPDLETQTPFKATAAAPQTPAQNKNPFAANPMLGGQALAASQLFKQTQQLSSAVKAGWSPTSSRPSPALPMYHHSISTNAIDSPLKNHVYITSPTAVPGSSQEPSPRPRTSSSFVEHQTPAPARWRDSDIPEETPRDPRIRPPKRFPEPMDRYESRKESQERRSSDEVVPTRDSFSEMDDTIAAELKRKRVAKLREETSRELSSISFPRPGPREVIEVPSTTQKAALHDTRRVQAQLESPTKGIGPMENDARISEVGDDNDQEEQENDDMSTVADSQEPAPAARAIAVESSVPRVPETTHEAAADLAPDLTYDSSNELIPDSTGCTTAEQANTRLATGDTVGAEDALPDTSPFLPPDDVRSADAPLEKTGDTAHQGLDAGRTATAENNVEPQLPEPFRRSGRVPRPTAKVKMIMSDGQSTVEQKALSSLGNGPAQAATPKPTNLDEFKGRSDVSVIPESSPGQFTQHRLQGLPSSPPIGRVSRMTNVLEASEDPPATAAVPTPTAPPSTMSSATSSLSSLQSTPEPPSTGKLPAQSPGRTSKRRQIAKPALSHMKSTLDDLRQSPRRNTRRTSRLPSRRNSTSTDELARLPSAHGFEDSMIRPQKIRNKGVPFSGSIRPKPRTSGDKLFSGMAFAVSFQPQQPGERDNAYERRKDLSSDIEQAIIEGGGRLLSNGFDELFSSTPLQLTTESAATEDDVQSSLGLVPSARTLGFTALIADGHSRKPKYMQALALGLPCISDRWITACIQKKAIVDWSTYLLCAGQSTFLRGAIRSRLLTPYAAEEARLVDVIQRRSQLLAGGKILLVMKKSRQEDKKMMYVFLTQVLGASLVRAHGMTEAQEIIRGQELLGKPFDWVYVDENTGTVEELLGGAPAAASATSGSRKRKRAVTPRVSGAKKIRTLNDELVIQSLILGRMIEEDDFEV